MLDSLLAEAPFDVTRYRNWSEFEREAARLAPDAGYLIGGLKGYHPEFERLIAASKAEVNRAFDDAQAAEAEAAEKLKAVNESLRQVRDSITAMSDRLQAKPRHSSLGEVQKTSASPTSHSG